MCKTRNTLPRNLIIVALCALFFGILYPIFRYNNVFAEEHKNGKCFYFIADIEKRHNTEATTSTASTVKICSPTGKTNDIELIGKNSDLGNDYKISLSKDKTELLTTYANENYSSISGDTQLYSEGYNDKGSIASYKTYNTRTYKLSDYSSLNDLGNQMKKDFFTDFKSGVTNTVIDGATEDSITATAPTDCMKTESYDAAIKEGAAEEVKEEEEDPPSTPDEAQMKEECKKSGVAMAWLTCEVLMDIVKIPDEMFNLIDGFLQISPSQIFVEGNGGTTFSQDTWNIFRNMANTVVVIILLIVVFSQVTGLGIDNYGIKKLLPKIIVMAILINLSYLICQLAVDISNITGTGAKELFTKIYKDFSAATIANNIGSLSIVIGIFAIYGATILPAIIVIILLLLIIAIICILVIAVSLGIRNVLVIVLVVISPLAFAAYILPNTQTLFKNWRKVFIACLLIYPICGALFGASLLTQAIIIGSGTMENVGAYLFALVAPVVPFLFIPKLLTAAMAGLGSLGSTIQSVTSAPKKAASAGARFAKKTDAYKDAKQRISDRIGEERAQRIRDKYQKKADKKGGLGGLSNSQRRRLYQAQTTLNDRAQQRAQYAAGISALDPETAQQRAEAARAAQDYKAFQDQFARPDFDLAGEADDTSWYDPQDVVKQQRMRALIGAMESRGMEKKIYEMLKKTDVSKDAATMSALNGSSDKVLKAYGKRGAGIKYEDFMNGTGENSMQGYIDDKGADFLDGLSDKSLAEIAAHGDGASMSTKLLVQAGSNINNNESLAQVNAMLEKRKDIAISAEQLANFNQLTFNAALQGDQSNIDALMSASDDIAKDPKLLAKLDPETRGHINALREFYGKGKI